MNNGRNEVPLFSGHVGVKAGTCLLALRRGQEVRVEGCALMRVLKGEASLYVNASAIEAAGGMWLYLAFDMTAISAGDTIMEVEYMALDSEVTGEFFFNIPSSALWDSLYRTPAFAVREELDIYLRGMLRQARWVEESYPGPVTRTVLRDGAHSVFAVLAAESETMTSGVNPPKTRAWTIANDFVTLLHRHYARHHDVGYYAGRLNITPDYLNVICRNFLGYTAKSRIDSQLVIAARTMLDTTDLPVKAIAERLHFDDPSYLCRVFRRLTGLTPLQYRNRHH